jgi:Cell division protein anillin
LLKLSFTDIFPKKDTSSNSDNLATPSPQQTNSSSSTCYPKKQSTSTTDNNNRVSSGPNTSSSNEYPKNITTPSSANSSGNGIVNLEPTQHSTAKKSSKVHFENAEENLEAKLKIPEILEVFTDIDLFIEKELSEISCRKRVGRKLADQDYSEAAEEVFTKLKLEYLKDKQQHQREFERQVNQSVEDKKLSMIQEENEAEMSLDLTFTLKMNRWRMRKIERLRLEAKKQEYLLGKINRVLEMAIIESRNIADVVTIERHYLVASMRLQAALTEYKRLTESSEPLHPRPFHHKGTCTVSEVMLEVKQRYFDRVNSAPNEFFVVLLKNDDEIYASRSLQIIEDIRTVKFPETFKIPEAYADFQMRLEIYGTTLWRKQHSIRSTMLKKYGFVNISLVDTGTKRKRFDMVEVIKSEHNPLRKKVLLKIHQTITPDVHFSAVLIVKLGDSWHKAYGRLCGHLLEINLIAEEKGDDHDEMLLDLHNFDSDFIIPVVSHVSKKPFTFLLKFNHYVGDNEF